MLNINMNKQGACKKQRKCKISGEGAVNNNNKDGDIGDSVNNNCGKCNEIVLEDDMAVMCDVCERWFHIKCENMPEEVYEYMKEVGEQMIWNCNDCKMGCVKLHRYIRKLEADNIRLSTRQDEIEVKFIEVKEVMVESESKSKDIDSRLGSVEAQSVVIMDKVEENCTQNGAVDRRLGTLEAKVVEMEDKISSEVNKLNNKPRTTEIEATGGNAERYSPEDTLFDELNARKNKETNMVVYGVPESASQVARERIQYDRSFTLKLLQACETVCDPSKITRVVRLGNKEDGKKRPMRVILSSVAIKTELFGNLSKLKGKENFKGVRVVHDMTKRERDLDAALWEEAKNLIAEGKGKHAVRGPLWRRRVVKMTEADPGRTEHQA